MRTFIVGAVIVMAMPAYAQQRDSAEESTTGRTAVPRGQTQTPAPRNDKPDDAMPSRAHRATPSAAETARRRFRDEHPQVAPARTYWMGSPTIPLRPSSIPRPNLGIEQLSAVQHRRSAHKDWDFGPRYRRSTGANVVFVPYATPVVVEREVVETVSAPVAVEQPSPARLILDIHPTHAEVFADGYYIGIPEDFQFQNGGAVLQPGPHRIDITAPGYESASFDVNLTRGQSATFRRTLAQINPPSHAAPDTAVKTSPAPKQPMTFYLIPGCYMGNVPPKEANLPATCDITRAVSFSADRDLRMAPSTK